MTVFRFVSRALFCILMAVAVHPAALDAQQRGRTATAPVEGAAPSIHGFSVVLLAGSMQMTGTNEGVPEAARKALVDMKDFLPYRRYHLLDAGWMLCCGSSRGATTVSGQLRGPNNREFSYTIDPMGTREARLNLRFTLREVASISDAAPGPSDVASLEQGRQLHEAVREAREAEADLKRSKEQGFTATHPDVLRTEQRLRAAQARVEILEARGTRTRGTNVRSLIDSTFAISPGETVVIGTSRLMGDQALIAILTAATRPGATR